MRNILNGWPGRKNKKDLNIRLKANRPKKPLNRRQKQRNELRAQQEFTLEKLMLIIQVCQHWGIIKIRQDGEILPVFDHNRNMPCSWLNTPGS